MDLSPGRLIALSIGACAVCCAVPILWAGGFAAAFLAWFSPSSLMIAGLLGAGALAIVTTAGRRKVRTDQAESAAGPTVCRLPPSDRAQRTRDFRALFAGGLVDRQRSPGRVSWALQAMPGRLSESRRLAALEERCCDGIQFTVREQGAQVHWEITGPASALPTLDALYELPLLVQDDEQAARLWASLDAASCGSGK